MMTVAEEVERALQIASAPQKVANRGASSTQKVLNRGASSAQEITNRGASSAQKVTIRGASSAQEFTNSVASTATAPSNNRSSPISSSDAVTVQRSRSPDFSSGLKNCSNSGEKANESCFENGRIIGGCCYGLIV